MSNRTPWLDALHLTALSIWLGGLLSAGLSASLIFPQMKSLRPHLPDYASYTGEHWKIAGGVVANRIFLIVDWVQLGCGLVAIVTLGLSLMAASRGTAGRRPPLAGARILLLSVACGLLCYQLFILAPRMAIHINDFWTAAKAGQQAVADAAQAAFDADHPTSRTLLTSIAASVLLMIVASAIGISRGGKAS
jgi:hypothetical protein